MAKKATDPFMGGLWDALVADRLGPGGAATPWAETPVRVRNRFCAAVRQILQSGAAFQASTVELTVTAKIAPPAGAPKAAGRRAKARDPRELQLPLMASVEPRAKKTGR